MKKHAMMLLLCGLLFSCQPKAEFPWDNGRLQVDPQTHRYLQFENGKPFFWLGETGWLLPERLNRMEAEFYLENCRQAGFNVVQVQTVNGVPARNVYGQLSMPEGFDFSHIDKEGVYGYWDHMDYIIETAASKGIYIGMVCIWGGLVKSGRMNEEQAKAYGTFLANRYKDHPNIIWFIGGDVRGDARPEVFNALAHSIKAIDKNHLMTFHPFGRTTSALWFHDADWLDLDMVQSGHRRYGQLKNGRYEASIIGDSTEEDNWRYIEMTMAYEPPKPVLDGEPSYEGIPQGLHDPKEPLWKDNDVRRYAYWSVFAGSCGHTYGNNSIMQMHRKGIGGYGATEHWVEALKNPGFSQMQYLKALMLTFPYFERVPDQSIIAGENGFRHDRLIATRGDDYLLVYNYTGRSMCLDLRKISGERKKAWWLNPANGRLQYIGEFDNAITTFEENTTQDRVLIAVDASKDYLAENQMEILKIKQ